ncbi:GNAT family N-acetyltransferase [Actinoplanes sp. NPDC048988]|uniref:GNAT family N-acetyltransferase n=1 Tax=Actinoplanes sp. NPDC048988 TaxID=3363901 RepID=UPI003722A5E4
MRTSLSTPRLRLRHFVAEDAPELHGLFSDPLTHTIGGGPFTELARTEQWIRNRGRAFEEHGLCWYAVRDAESGLLVGNCGMLTGRTGPAEPEIGYLIGRSFRGRGFASEAARAVLHECRAAGFGRVWSSVRPGNAASRRIVEALALRVERTEHDERGALLFSVIDLPA